MSSTLKLNPTIRTLADLIDRLGGVAPGRILFQPAPGRATEADLLGLKARENRLFELVDGALVEKAMGYRESLLAIALAGFLSAFVVPRNLGLVSGADGLVRLVPGLVRIPDVAFTSWDRLPNRRVPSGSIPDLVPDLAVEIRSEGNTEAELDRKRREYFEAGVRLVWMIDPKSRMVQVFSGPESAATLTADQTLDGGEVLSGFRVELRELFAELDRRGDRYRSELLPAIEQQSNRAVIDEFHLHHGAEDSGGDLETSAPDAGGEVKVKTLGLGRVGRLGKAGPAPGAAVAQEGELAHHEHRAAGLRHVAVHLALVVLEGAEVDDLLGEAVGVVVGVAPRHSQEDEPADADPSDAFALYLDRRSHHPLQHRAHPARLLPPIPRDTAARPGPNVPYRRGDVASWALFWVVDSGREW